MRLPNLDSAVLRPLLLSGIAASLLAMTVTPSHSQLPFPFPPNDNCPVKATGATAAFDRRHDRDTVGGGSLFCRLGITASQANQSISELKTAVTTPSSPSATKILRFPIEIVVYDGKRKNANLMLHTRAEWVAFVRNKLNDRQRGAISATKLTDMMIVNSKGAGPGFILGDGLVFFSTRNPHHIVVWHLDTEVLGD